jgi:hypothetical protein
MWPALATFVCRMVSRWPGARQSAASAASLRMRAYSFALLEPCGRHNLNGILPRPAAGGVPCSVMDVVPAAVIHFVAPVCDRARNMLIDS